MIQMIAGAILFVAMGVILLRFGKAIAQVLLLVGLLMVSVWLYFSFTSTTPPIPELGPGMPPAIPEVIPTPLPTPTKPEGWLGALSDAATVVRAFRPEKRAEPVQQVQAVPPQASVTTAGGLLPMFCAGAALTITLQALGVAAWFYIRWQYGGQLQLPLTGRRREEPRLSKSTPSDTPPAVYLIDCTDEQTPQRGTASLDLLVGDDWGF